MALADARSRECPFVESLPSLAERVLDGWVRPRDEAIKGDGEIERELADRASLRASLMG